MNGYQYVNTVLDFFPTPEGYVKATLGRLGVYTYSYVYNYKDHLGNNRLSYTTSLTIGDPNLIVMDENHYYPFGLKHNGYSTIQQLMLPTEQPPYVVLVPAPTATAGTYKIKYNGKELQDELGLNIYDYGARNYDPALGRWMNIDPLSEISRRYSPYTYALNNPVYFIDPDGMASVAPSSAGFNSKDFNVKVNVGNGIMRDSRSLGSSTSFSGANIEFSKSGKEKINNNLSEYIKQAGFDPKEKLSNLPEEERPGRVWNLATRVTPLVLIGEAAGGLGEGIKIGYEYSLPDGAKGQYEDSISTITMSSKAFYRDNLYLATLIGHELIHAFDHKSGIYANFGVRLGYMPVGARAMLEVRAYQMQRWLSGGKFIDSEDEKFYNHYYREAKELLTNYGFIIKHYPTFFNNIQK